MCRSARASRDVATLCALVQPDLQKKLDPSLVDASTDPVSLRPRLGLIRLAPDVGWPHSASTMSAKFSTASLVLRRAAAREPVGDTWLIFRGTAPPPSPSS